MKRAPAGLGVPNRFKVSKRMWRKWPPLARRVFNDLYEDMRDNQRLYLATGVAPIPAKRWRVTCWNAAFIAACLVRPRKGEDGWKRTRVQCS